MNKSIVVLGAVYRAKTNWPTQEIKKGTLGFIFKMEESGNTLLFSNGKTIKLVNESVVHDLEYIGPSESVVMYKYVDEFRLLQDFHSKNFAAAFTLSDIMD